MTNLVLVRHGETIWHAENRYAGISDVALTPRGYEQAKLLAGWARTAGLDAVWVSPLLRAQETAALAARAGGLMPQVDERLHELDFGQGEGRTVAEMEQLFPEALAAYHSDPVAHHLPGGEDPQKAVERVIACFKDITLAYPCGRVLVVAHTTLFRLALCRLLGIPLRLYRTVFPFMRNGALTEIRLDGDTVALFEFNAPIESRIAPVSQPVAEAETTLRMVRETR
jgi:broad specificity phosphatase PhoE